MAKRRLSLHHHVLIVCILLQCSIVHTNQSSFPCFQPQQDPTPPVWPPSLTIVFVAGNHSDGSLFNETLDDDETHGLGSERNQSENEKKQQERMPECVCQCRMSDRVKSGRFKRRPCRLQWRFVFSANTVTEKEYCCCRHPLPFSGPDTESGRRCRKLQWFSWSVDCTPNARGQAQRNRLSCLGCGVKETVRSPDSLHGGLGTRRVHDLLLMSQNQRNEGGGSGKGSFVLRQLMVSLVAALLLYLGYRSRQKTTRAGLRERLGILLHGPAFVSRTERKDKAIKQTTWCSSSVPVRPRGGSISAPRGSPSPTRRNKPSQGGEDFPQCGGAHSGGVPDWCFHTRWLAPFARLVRVAPVTFLPSMTSPQDSSRLDHLGYRLASLSALPSSCSLSRVRLAEAGFHYDPSAQPSALRCHRCPALYGLGQVPGDPGPLHVHQATSPQCPLVLVASQKFRGPPPPVDPVPGPSVSGSVADGQELSEDGEGTRSDPGRRAVDGIGQTSDVQRKTSDTGYVLALAGSNKDQIFEPKTRAVNGIAGSVSSFSASASSSAAGDEGGHHETDSHIPSSGGSLSLGEAVYPQFSTVKSRLVTFRGWPSEMTTGFPPQYMVDLGFYFAGYADCVRCFYCGVGLKSWDPQDDALTEHLRWRPQCGYLLATRSPHTIQRLLRTIHGAREAHQEVGTNGHSRGAPSSTPRGADGSPPVSGSGNDVNGGDASVVQQLMTMGFFLKDIDAARARLRDSGSPQDVQNILQILLPQD